LVEYCLGDYPAAEALADQALEIAKTEGDDDLAVKAQLLLAWARYRQGDDQGCARFIDEALPVARRLPNASAAAHVLNLQAYRLSALGEDAKASFAEAAALYRRAGDRNGTAVVLANMGGSALEAGDLDAAHMALDEAAGVFRELNHRPNLAACTAMEGTVAYLKGDDRDANRLFRECLDVGRRIGGSRLVAYALLGLALTATRLGDARRAATLHGVFDAREASLDSLEAGLRDADIAGLRAVLGDASFDIAYDVGRALPLDDAYTLAGRLPVLADDPSGLVGQVN
jgi:hypothetical protein